MYSESRLPQGTYLMYLRKSRQDDPNETVEEVLQKHETMLQNLALQLLGRKIPEDCIFREVVSGESIRERDEFQKVLAHIENPDVRGVFVVDGARLSRGSLEECGRIVSIFKVTKTLVITYTPQMVYNLDNKMHRKFLEQELMRSGDFLEMTKEVLLRGRHNSVQNKGSYIGNIAPYGYDKFEDDIGPTLTPNAQSEVIKLVFDMFVNQGKNYLQIARHLDSMGIKPMKGDKWNKSSIKSMLKNIHYIGMVIFGKHRTELTYENGVLVKRRNMPNDPEDVIIAKGRHQALVTKEIFDKAQELMGKSNTSREKWGAPLVNPLAGLLFCSKCGKALVQQPYPHAKTRIGCRSWNGCGGNSTFLDEIVDAVAYALENEQLPQLEIKLQTDDGNAYTIQKKQLEKLRQDLADLGAQEEKQFDLLEKGIYSEELFIKRNKALHDEMDALKKKIYEASQVLPKQIDYAEKIVMLKDAVASLRDKSATPSEQNKLVKNIVERIDYEFIERIGKGKSVYALHISLLL